MGFSAPVIELYPELEAVLEVVDPVLVKGVGFTIVGGLMVLLLFVFILPRPRIRPGPAVVVVVVCTAASVWLLLFTVEAVEVAEATVTAPLGDLCAAAALIMMRRVSSALLG